MRIISGKLTFNPIIPEQWKSFSFHARFRDNLFKVKITESEIEITNISGNTLELMIFNKFYEIKGSEKLTVKIDY
jgi:maltose phosphorylase